MYKNNSRDSSNLSVIVRIRLLFLYKTVMQAGVTKLSKTT